MRKHVRIWTAGLVLMAQDGVGKVRETLPFAAFISKLLVAALWPVPIVFGLGTVVGYEDAGLAAMVAGGVWYFLVALPYTRGMDDA